MDGDGFGDAGAPSFLCEGASGFVVDDTDCDDTNAAINPGEIEDNDNSKDDDCNGYTDELAVPSAFGTIQEALDRASTGDVVLVARGTYTEALDMPPTALSLIGEDGAEVTIVDAAGAGSALELTQGGGSVAVAVEGLWFTGGVNEESYSGGTISCDGAGPLALMDVIVTGGSASWYGGGIGLDDCDVSLVRVSVADNEARIGGGGISVRGGASVDAENLLVVGNRATSGGGGGGIYVYTSSASISQATVVGNSAGGSGGGVASLGTSSSVELTNSIVAFNSCDGYGCGLYGSAPATVLDATYVDVYDNDAYGQVSFSSGVEGDIEEDPLLVSWSEGADWVDQDLHLQAAADGDPADSPCIDGGDPSTSDADGSRADMGYYGGGGAP